VITIPGLPGLAAQDPHVYEAFKAIAEAGATAKDVVRRDGKSALVADWNAGNFDVTAGTFTVPPMSPGSGAGIFAGTRADTTRLTEIPGQAPWALVRIFQPALAPGGQAGGNVFVGGAGNDTMSNGAGAGTLATGNVGVGITALFALTTGFQNTGIGQDALYTNTTGYYNTAVGSNALGFNTVGAGNTALGTTSLFLNIDGGSNTAVGHNALNLNLHGGYCTAVGHGALEKSTVDNLVAVGFNALNANTTGASNTAVGTLALVSNQGGGSNSAFGLASLASCVSGGTNSGFGMYSLYSTSGSGNVALGYSAGFYESGSNALYIDNQDRGSSANDKANALVYGVFDAAVANQRLTFNALTTVNGKFATTESVATLSNGANQNVAVTTSFVNIIGPSAGFGIGGIAAPTTGQKVTFFSAVNQVMTVNYEDGGSTATNRITTSTLANVACGGTTYAWFTVQYSTNTGRWILVGHS
jgi:hypothetical protein